MDDLEGKWERIAGIAGAGNAPNIADLAAYDLQRELAGKGEAVNQCPHCGSYRIDSQPPALHKPGCPRNADPAGSYPHGQALAAGLRWLYDTEQPDGSILQHHGVTLASDGDRRLRFIPSARIFDSSRIRGNHPVVVVDVAHVEWGFDEDGDPRPANPLRPTELLEFTTAIGGLGGEVISTWNGHPACTGSLALARPAHPTLLAAVDRYHAGCPDHPDKGVFCRCGWYQTGYRLIVQPDRPSMWAAQ